MRTKASQLTKQVLEELNRLLRKERKMSEQWKKDKARLDRKTAWENGESLAGYDRRMKLMSEYTERIVDQRFDFPSSNEISRRKLEEGAYLRGAMEEREHIIAVIKAEAVRCVPDEELTEDEMHDMTEKQRIVNRILRRLL